MANTPTKKAATKKTPVAPAQPTTPVAPAQPTNPAPTVAQPTTPAPTVAQSTNPVPPVAPPATVIAQVPPAPARRKVLKLADRLELIKGDIAKIPALTQENVIAVVTRHLTTSTKGSKSSVTSTVDANGVVIYHCARTNKWFRLEDMVINKDGSSRGYSKASHDVLTQANADLRRLSEESQNVLLDGDATRALQLAQERNAIETAKSNGTIYTNIQATAVPA